MKNIVETAISAGGFENLVAAVRKANLDKVLSGKGPFTVFAPTDKAFDKIPKKQLADILNDSEQLTKILTYHVVEGKCLADQMNDGSVFRTVEGGKLHVKNKKRILGGKRVVKVNDSSVLTPNIMTSNGVIHVIDKVLIPQ